METSVKNPAVRQKVFTTFALSLAALGIVFIGVKIRSDWARHSPIETVHITGAVLRQDKHPNKQAPIANAKIVATGGLFDVEAKSDSAGYFQLYLRPGFRREPVNLRFEHSEYKPVEITRPPEDGLYIVRMDPLAPEPVREAPPTGAEKVLPIRDIRVRYTMKTETTMDVGSLAKQFEVVNTGSVPCDGHAPCSPDGQWKGKIGSLSLDAQNGNLFRNVRVTCVAGPCPFTKILPVDLSRPSRVIHVSVLNWSDSATFLVEAEVTRTAVRDTLRRSYPTIIGQTMTFALPAEAEGPTIEAVLNGEEIVFPLGPRLLLSWATCGVDIANDKNRTYRCELKTGYAFPQ